MCNFGVPQGSVLRPLLLLLYINDINHSLDEVIIKLFADDTNCFFSAEDFGSLMEIVTREMNSLQNWINANKLTINFDPNNKTNDLILNLTPENVTQHSRIVTTTRKGSSTPTKMSKIIGRQIH